jgi:hypothetical protein
LKFGASLQVFDQYFVLIHSDSCFSVITSRKVSDFAETIATKPDKFCQRIEKSGKCHTQTHTTSELDHSPVPSIIIGRKESPDTLQHEANPKNRNDDE